MFFSVLIEEDEKGNIVEKKRLSIKPIFLLFIILFSSSVTYAQEQKLEAMHVFAMKNDVSPQYLSSDDSQHVGSYPIPFTEAEEIWLKNHKNIRISGPKAFPPFHYFDAAGNLQGMTADYARLIFNRLNLTPDIQSSLPWTDVLKKAAEKEIDVISLSAKSADREKYLLFTDAYLSFPLVIITRIDAPFVGGIYDLHGKKIALTEGNVTYDWIMQDKFKVIPHLEKTPLEALEAVSLGKADAGIENLAAATYLIQKHGLTNLKIAAPTPYGNYNLYIAVRNDWPELVSIFNKIISTITAEQHSEIQNKWLAVRYEHGIRKSDVLKWILGVIGISVVILSVIILWNRKLNREIHERKRTEDALRESEEKFRLTFNFSPDAVNINRLDDGLYVDINEGFTQLTGFTREDAIGRTSLEINIWHDPADRQKLVQGLLQKGLYENLEAQFRGKNGNLITALMSARVISLKGVPHIISITRDITERKLFAAKLQQAQKFEAIGTLAGGIAHDFNNLLMGIQGRASILSLDMDTSHPHWEHINAIEEYIRNATNLTKQLLGFARGGKYEVKPIDINDLVLGSSAMFGRTKKEIQIHTKCQQSHLVVEADRGQINQVLLNLYLNAWQAMPPEGGDLYLETMTVTLDETYCKPNQIDPGRYVKVSITDSGTGMDEATRLQIFDPFFTTKGKSRGTGLGLASAFGIIKNHGGMITVYSEIGHGTTFNIYLLVSDKNAHQDIPKEGGLIKGSANILMVDDEEMIVDVGQAMLERLGYRVMTCRGGQEAVQTIEDRGNEIDLVILDMIMPGMDGGTTFDRIREIQPEMPVILSSGYAINGHADKIMRRGCNGFIQKPYNISDLSNKVRNVLVESKGSNQR
jgi:PAS domain S-box-containing protein